MCYAALQNKALKSQLGPFDFQIMVKIQGDLLERLVYPLKKMYFMRQAESEIELIEGQFGLVPDWVDDERKGPAFGRHCYNARSETIFEKPSFRKAILSKRAVIPVSAYLEIADLGELQGSHFQVLRTDSKPIYLAALWEHNSRYNLTSCSIITAEPMDFVKAHHSRSPVILDESEIKKWLDTQNHSPNDIRPFLKTGDGKALTIEITKKKQA